MIVRVAPAGHPELDHDAIETGHRQHNSNGVEYVEVRRLDNAIWEMIPTNWIAYQVQA